MLRADRVSARGRSGGCHPRPGEKPAAAYIDRYFQRFPGIQNYINETTASVRELGFTTTLFGRKTHFPNISSRQQNLRQGSERAAINAPIQGTSADIIKRAMARMTPALREAGLPKVRMLLQVHDELVFEVAPQELDAVSALDGVGKLAGKTVRNALPPGKTLNWGVDSLGTADQRYRALYPAIEEARQ